MKKTQGDKLMEGYGMDGDGCKEVKKSQGMTRIQKAAANCKFIEELDSESILCVSSRIILQNSLTVIFIFSVKTDGIS